MAKGQGFKGHMRLEDHVIDWCESETPGMMQVTVMDLFPIVKEETLEVPQSAFFKALAIAVHPDGMPDTVKDYPEAETAMGEIRWIP